MAPSVLIIGASRGLGLLLVDAFAARGWSVVGTTRSPSPALEAVVGRRAGRVRTASVDMTDAASITALRARLAGEAFDVLVVNGAVNRSSGSVDQAGADEFVEVLTTNALAPLRVIEALQDLVAASGTIAVMSSEQGSVSRNEEEGFEVYKASKAALNQLVRSYANRTADGGRSLLLLDPGHNRTELGGDDAPFDPAESTTLLAEVIERYLGVPGLRFLDRDGETVPW